MQGMADQPAKAPTPAAVEKLLDNLTWTEVPKPEGVEPGTPYPTHQGVIKFGGMANGAELKCYRLSNGQRVFDGHDVVRIFGAPVP